MVSRGFVTKKTGFEHDAK